MISAKFDVTEDQKSVGLDGVPGRQLDRLFTTATLATRNAQCGGENEPRDVLDKAHCRVIGEFARDRLLCDQRALVIELAKKIAKKCLGFRLNHQITSSVFNQRLQQLGMLLPVGVLPAPHIGIRIDK